MFERRKRIQGAAVACATAAVALGGWMTPAGATFIIDPNPGGAQFKIDNANKDVNTFTGTVGGTIENPKGCVDAANSAQANLMGLAQSAQNLAEVPLGAISGAIGGPGRLSSGGDDCAAQLAMARGGPGGPQPNSPPSMLAVPANAAKQILKAPKNLLQNLFGK
jgi:hypothetical protein